MPYVPVKAMMHGIFPANAFFTVFRLFLYSFETDACSYFRWSDVFKNRPKLAAWWAAVGQDPEAAKVLPLSQSLNLRAYSLLNHVIVSC